MGYIVSKPRFIIYECTECSNTVTVELDINNLTYFKSPTLYCKNDLYQMKTRIIKENEIKKEEDV